MRLPYPKRKNGYAGTLGTRISAFPYILINQIQKLTFLH